MSSAGVPYEEISSSLSSVEWNSVLNKPNLYDWTIDQGDTNIDASNIPVLSYAANQLANGVTPGLSTFNFNTSRKEKLEGLSILSIGDGGLTEKNFTGTLKTKLDGITEGADVNPSVGDNGLTEKNFTGTLRTNLNSNTITLLSIHRNNNGNIGILHAPSYPLDVSENCLKREKWKKK